MRKYQLIIAFFFTILILLLGCIDSEIENKDPDPELKNNIIGLWAKNEPFENFTYKITYEFYPNMSFFSGILNEDLTSYNISIWGKYIIDNETLKFIVDGDNPSNSTHKYFISNDSNNLLIYYEDEVNYDVYLKENK
jgi:hypothetical protein